MEEARTIVSQNKQIDVRIKLKELIANKDRPVFFQNALSRLPMLSENLRKIWMIMIFHRGSGCRHCLDGSLVDVYWDTFHEYEMYLNVLMTWFVPLQSAYSRLE